ncbi:MAG: acyl-CoA dehydrogenase family protein [Sphingobium sp.]|nr:acyl-CoA dehydrogenase family protein [Sphingobium sp.]
MDFALSDEHLMLRESAQDFLSAEVDLGPLLLPGATVSAAKRDALWAKMVELGWTALVIPEDDGGYGMSHVDLMMIIEQVGRSLAPCSLFGTLAGTWAILAAGSPPQREALLPGVASGERRLALAVADRRGRVGPLDMVARQAGTGWRLEGHSALVLDAGEADQIVVAAKLDGVSRLFLVDRNASGLAVDLLEWRDITRAVYRLEASDTAAELMPGDFTVVWPWIRDRLYLLLAAESLGGLAQVVEATVDYAKERVAFGRPIGAYQAIKHQLADMKGDLECASAAVLYAAWALDADPEAASLAAAMAQAFTGEAYANAAFRSIQIFGAIGFTWEMRNHLYFKRARANAELLGSPAQQRAEISDVLHARQQMANV